ncbi:hypothetical protein QUA70_12505 [Microcoleus sp. LAD1_D5]|uniref:hypothetical protein n=1 Tax=Microcoleus sp. LAD1_D5 TaxID=2818813 RepID=UPI002FD5DA7C
MPDDLLLPKVQEFVHRFESVFEGDWGHTRECLEDIPRDENFLRSTSTEFYTSDHWNNYIALLDAYRDLKAFMKSEGIHPDDGKK